MGHQRVTFRGDAFTATMEGCAIGVSSRAWRDADNSQPRSPLVGLRHPALGRDTLAADEVGPFVGMQIPMDVVPGCRCVCLEVSGLPGLFAPENGVCFAMLKRLGPFELGALGAMSRHFKRLLDDPAIDLFWARLYGHHFHMTHRDASEYGHLRPRQIFARLASLSISGKWHVTGRLTQMEQEVENAYGYIQFFKERERISPIECSFEGEVEDDESAFLVEGKMVGNSVVMYETITNHSNAPIAVNICSGVLSLRGSFMSGVWTQHNPSNSRVLSATISSGIFEAAKLEDVGVRARINRSVP